MKEIKLKCSCWKVQGIAKNVAPNTGNRIICHCTDCQAFAEYLGRESTILDEYKGTDIFQMPMAYVDITTWKENIKCIRLTEKGLHRWYADCCKTPIGNTMWAKIPFMGIIHNFMDDKWSRDENLWPVLANTLLKERLWERKATSPFKFMPRIIGKLISWKIKGLNTPSVFFDTNGIPISEPKIIKS